MQKLFEQQHPSKEPKSSSCLLQGAEQLVLLKNRAWTCTVREWKHKQGHRKMKQKFSSTLKSQRLQGNYLPHKAFVIHSKLYPKMGKKTKNIWFLLKTRSKLFPFFQLGVSVWQVPVKRPVMCEWVKQIIYCAEQNNTVSPSFNSAVPLAAAAVCVFWPAFQSWWWLSGVFAGWAANCLFQMGQFHFFFLFIYYFYKNLFKEPCWEAALFVSFLLLFHKLKKILSSSSILYPPISPHDVT